MKKITVDRMIFGLGRRGMLKFLSDERYLKMTYYMEFKKKLNLDNPKSFNEKLQWLKLNDRKDLYTKLVDKYEVKKYVSDIIGDEYIIPTLGIYDKFEEIDFNTLPNQFVMKCTHDSGSIVVVKDKSKMDIKSSKKKIKKGLKNNGYNYGREWPYKNVKPRIIIEKYMEDERDKELRDYKFFCFNGEPKFMFLATDRQIHKTKFNFYDLDFKLLPFTQGHPNDTRKIEKPKSFDLMIKLAKKLSKNIPQVRIDFYEVNGKPYFGEITFYHYSGLKKFNPHEWDLKFGEYIKLPNNKKEVNKNEK